MTKGRASYATVIDQSVNDMFHRYFVQYCCTQFSFVFVFEMSVGFRPIF